MPNNNPTAKEKWVQKQHDKAVKIHHANIDRIENLTDKMKSKTFEISQLQLSIGLLIKEQCDLQYGYFSKKENRAFNRADTGFEEDHGATYFGENYSWGIDARRKCQQELCIEVANLKAAIDSHSFEDSLTIMKRASDEERLGKEYDKKQKKEAA